MKTIEYLESLSDIERFNLFEKAYMVSKKMYCSLVTCWFIDNGDDCVNHRINSKLLES